MNRLLSLWTDPNQSQSPFPPPKLPLRPKIAPNAGGKRMNEKSLTTNFLLGSRSFNMMDFHKSAMHYGQFPALPKRTFDELLLIF